MLLDVRLKYKTFLNIDENHELEIIHSVEDVAKGIAEKIKI